MLDNLLFVCLFVSIFNIWRKVFRQYFRSFLNFTPFKVNIQLEEWCLKNLSVLTRFTGNCWKFLPHIESQSRSQLFLSENNIFNQICYLSHKCNHFHLWEILSCLCPQVMQPGWRCKERGGGSQGVLLQRKEAPFPLTLGFPAKGLPLLSLWPALENQKSSLLGTASWPHRQRTRN